MPASGLVEGQATVARFPLLFFACFLSRPTVKTTNPSPPRRQIVFRLRGFLAW
jgi:hypothetical protein